MQNRVLVLDNQRQPLMPCHPARARMLLREGKAAVFRRFPFTIIVKERAGGDVQPVRVKCDPGSKTTGMALVAEFARRRPTVAWAAELTHRGETFRGALRQRAACRRSRRNRKTRYRAPRFDNRKRSEGWLPPSLRHRVDTTMTWIGRLRRLAPVSALSQELVRFDMQAMQNPEISGIEHQQGTLAGYEVREYLLEKWGRKCAYCGAKDVPLEIDHIHPKSRGGSDRVSNLTLACHDCNQTKGNRDVGEFLAKRPERLAAILAKAKTPLNDAAAINSTRWALYNRIKATGLPVETGSGGRTKYNRSQQRYPKAHWIDAACVGHSGSAVRLDAGMRPLLMEATGHGERQRARVDKLGFPIAHKRAGKSFRGFRTGDLVRCRKPDLPDFIGRLAIRFRPWFVVSRSDRKIEVHPKDLVVVQKGDGYAYA
ncbi:RNA-guided endonuclease IscB [Verrucomicrobium sp. 3C]|uniref:RNA-guided endonuclease IscB n=1 Tax=Verrucomicrobium sp. 3C TaxID=1134055 RepID=UPI0003780067|nr:RNA-guided endonuclease IscB [Verrucomicrobium sp. 3C]